jgi:membrane peptidoglycan carboxypeptidase
MQQNLPPILRRPHFYFQALVVLLLFYNYVLPLPTKEFDIEYSCIIKANDSNGTIIGSIPVKEMRSDNLTRKVAITMIENVPSNLTSCLFATEDRTFYHRFKNFLGVNWKGLARAVIRGYGGGSGLVQQQVKFLFLQDPPADNLNRKATEAIVSANLDHTYSRDYLLLTYLNNVPFANNVSGFRTAAGHYFGKNLNDLRIYEMATLVGFLQLPSVYSRSNEAAQKRRNQVLKNLLETNNISEAEYEKYTQIPVRLKTLDPVRQNLPFFSDPLNHHEAFYLEYVKNEIETNFDTLQNLSGLTIYTSYVPKVQFAAERAIIETFETMPDYVRQDLQVGLVTVEASTGKIRAMLGCNPLTDTTKGTGTNYATISHQAGSTFKPFAYGAFWAKASNSLSSTLPNYPIAPYNFNPHNFDGSMGNGRDLAASYCLAQSLNIPAVNLIKDNRVSVAEIQRFARNCGIDQPQMPNNASIVLGTGDVTPLQLANAYSTIANRGYRRKPIATLTIKKNNKTVVAVRNYLRKNNSRVVSRRATDALVSALRQVIQKGTATSIKPHFDDPTAFGKTGTTNEHRDVWFVGYTNKAWKDGLVTAIWIGYPDRRSLPDGYNTGGTLAAPIWGRMMKILSKQ